MLQLFALAAKSWTNYLVDIVVILVLFGFALGCAKKGFIECFFRFVSLAVALLAAVLLSKMFISLLNEWFGIGTLFTDYFEKAFLKIEGFSIDISAGGIQTALADKNLPQFLIDLVLENFGDETIPAGTTLALVLGETVSKLLVSAIAFIVIFIAARLLMNLLKKILKLLASKISLIGAVDQLLGAGVGLIEGFLLIDLLLGLLALVPSEVITVYINKSIILSWIYNNNLINMVFGWISSL